MAKCNEPKKHYQIQNQKRKWPQYLNKSVSNYEANDSNPQLPITEYDETRIAEADTNATPITDITLLHNQLDAILDMVSKNHDQDELYHEATVHGESNDMSQYDICESSLDGNSDDEMYTYIHKLPIRTSINTM